MVSRNGTHYQSARTPASLPTGVDQIPSGASDPHLMRSVVAHAADAILITKMHGSGASGPLIVYANPAFEQMTGYTAAEVLGRSPRLLQGAETDHATLRRVREAVHAQEPIRVELLNYRKDGSPFWVEIQIVPVFGEAGVCSHFVSIQRDVTARHLIEEQLRASESGFRRALDGVSMVLFTHDLELRYTWVHSPLSTPMANAMLGKTDLELFGPVKGARLMEHKLQALQKGCPVVVEVDLGSEHAPEWYELRSEPIRDRDGVMIGLRCVGVDRTAQRAAERQIAYVERMSALGQLAGGIAHDFNNMHMALAGCLSMLREWLPDVPDAHADLDMAEQMVARASNLVRRLLGIGGSQEPTRRPESLNAVIVQMAPLLRVAIGGAINLDLKLGSGPCLVQIDAAQIEQVILNLCLNSRDAMPDGGVVTLSTMEGVDRAGRPLVRLIVRDTGEGMSETTRARIFDAFYTTKIHGTGLGLATCAAIIREHQGMISVSSAIGMGTTFTVELPGGVA